MSNRITLRSESGTPDDVVIQYGTDILYPIFIIRITGSHNTSCDHTLKNNADALAEYSRVITRRSGSDDTEIHGNSLIGGYIPTPGGIAGHAAVIYHGLLLTSSSEVEIPHNCLFIAGSTSASVSVCLSHSMTGYVMIDNLLGNRGNGLLCCGGTGMPHPHGRVCLACAASAVNEVHVESLPDTGAKTVTKSGKDAGARWNNTTVDGLSLCFHQDSYAH